MHRGNVTKKNAKSGAMCELKRPCMWNRERIYATSVNLVFPSPSSYILTLKYTNIFSLLLSFIMSYDLVLDLLVKKCTTNLRQVRAISDTLEGETANETARQLYRICNIQIHTRFGILGGGADIICVQSP